MNNTREQGMDKAQEAMYNLEHSAAWVLAIVALGLAIVGTVVGLGVYELREGTVNFAGTSAEGSTFLTITSGTALCCCSRR